MRTTRFAWVLLALIPGCGLTLDFDPPDTFDAAVVDAGPLLDGGTFDGGTFDAGTVDAGTVDAAGPDAGQVDAGPPPGCGNDILEAGELCDDGNTTSGDGCEPSCRPTCSSDTECEPADACSTGLCVAGFGCSSAVIDEDGDGWVAALDPICGDDCDDTEASIHPGAPELCDGIDQSCEGMVDEGVLLACLQDLDGDGWGSPFEACECPAVPPRGGGDCQDIGGDTFSRIIRPGQPNWFREPYTRLDGSTSFDFDCDGADAAGAVEGAGDEDVVEERLVGGGWTLAVAACGVRTDFTHCLSSATLGLCEPLPGFETQASH